jgi:hypothetical protein
MMGPIHCTSIDTVRIYIVEHEVENKQNIFQGHLKTGLNSKGERHGYVGRGVEGRSVRGLLPE